MTSLPRGSPGRGRERGAGTLASEGRLLGGLPGKFAEARAQRTAGGRAGWTRTPPGDRSAARAGAARVGTREEAARPAGASPARCSQPAGLRAPRHPDLCASFCVDSGLPWALAPGWCREEKLCYILRELPGKSSRALGAWGDADREGRKRQARENWGVREWNQCALCLGAG